MTRTEHIEALLRREPAWRFVRDGPFGSAALEGPVVIRGGTGKEYRFRVRIDVPSGFPARDAHPEVWLLESPFPHADDAHVNEEGTLCVELPRAHELDCETIGLVGFFEQVVLHLDRLRIHALTGKYPGPEYAHGDDGLRQHLCEVHAAATTGLHPALARAAWPGAPLLPDRQHCPCGSGQRFVQCHKAEVKAARARVVAVGPVPRRRITARASPHRFRPYRRRG